VGLAEAAIERLKSVRVVTDALGVDGDHQRLSLIPATPKDCVFCPLYSAAPVDGTYTCQRG
jgi:hypothetical protein